MIPETVAEAVARLAAYYRIEPVSGEMRAVLEREAGMALEIPALPELAPGPHGHCRCPSCGRILARNCVPTDRDGFASLNCTVHGWVGKWKP